MKAIPLEHISTCLLLGNMREQRRRRLITLPHQIDNAATSVTKSSPSTVNDDSHPAPCKMHDTSSKMKASDGSQMMPSSRICYIVVLTLTFYLGGHYCRYSWKCCGVYEESKDNRLGRWQTICTASMVKSIYYIFLKPLYIWKRTLVYHWSDNN